MYSMLFTSTDYLLANYTFIYNIYLLTRHVILKRMQLLLLAITMDIGDSEIHVYHEQSIS